MIIGVKYCGGCNPHFSRKKLVEKLKADTNDNVIFKPVSKNKLFDLIILINGCEKSCLSNTNKSLLCISPPLNYDHILMLIDKSYKSYTIDNNDLNSNP